MGSINSHAFGRSKLLQDYVNGTTAVINDFSSVVPLTTSSSNLTVFSRYSKCVLKQIKIYRATAFTTREDATGNTITTGDIEVDVELILDGISFIETIKLGAGSGGGSAYGLFDDLFVVAAFNYGGESNYTTIPANRAAAIKIKAVRSIYAGYTFVSGSIKIECKEIF